MNALLVFARWIDWLSIKMGRAVGWLILLTTVISSYNALARKAFDYSSNGLLEIQWYLFAAVFLLGAAYTLQQNAHVRIDVASNRFSERTRAWIDITGHVLFTLPMIGFVVVSGWEFAFASYSVNEYSPDTGGLIRWPAKALIVIGFLLLGLQVCAEIIKKLAILKQPATSCP